MLHHITTKEREIQRYFLFIIRSPENFFPCEICTVLKTQESHSGKVNEPALHPFHSGGKEILITW